MSEAIPIHSATLEIIRAERGNDCADLLVESGRVVIVDKKVVNNAAIFENKN